MIRLIKSRSFALLIAISMLSACAQILPPQPDDPYFAPPPAMAKNLSNNGPQAGAIYSLSSASFLFSDRKASRVGDLITVLLNEKTTSTKNSDTEIKKKDAGALDAPTLSGRIPTYNGNPLSFNFDTNRKFKAEADSSQANSLKGTITVSIAQVLQNGNLLIRGEKWLTLNQGNEFIRISGIIRPADISPDNTISSTRVANARISYSGTGDLNESNRMGWLSKFFNSRLFPL